MQAHAIKGNPSRDSSLNTPVCKMHKVPLPPPPGNLEFCGFCPLSSLSALQHSQSSSLNPARARAPVFQPLAGTIPTCIQSSLSRSPFPLPPRATGIMFKRPNCHLLSHFHYSSTHSVCLPHSLSRLAWRSSSGMVVIAIDVLSAAADACGTEHIGR